MLGLLLRLGGALLVGAAATVAVAAICVTVSELISPRQIARTARIKCPGALKVVITGAPVRNVGLYSEAGIIKCTEEFRKLITSNDLRKVYCDVYNKNDEKVGEMTIESSEGVDSSIYVGQEIYV